MEDSSSRENKNYYIYYIDTAGIRASATHFNLHIQSNYLGTWWLWEREIMIMDGRKDTVNSCVHFTRNVLQRSSVFSLCEG